MTKPELVEISSQGLQLDWKAFNAILNSLRFQLTAWRAKSEADMDEDDFIDLQNDIGYLEILLSFLEEEYEKRY